ncbi:uncharacterized protein zgc:113691 [Pristis pectinata]|uniref:uncharacterized protein zgc:113691 n=1 Tax=Pristis pectinata TaxID=685728 RepID=UPI00223D37F1|nr:uncharacterized protein zgc:113691 [Pristis pectinata]
MSSPKGETRESVAQKNTLTKYETKKLLLKYRKERDEASRKGEVNRNKLHVIQTSMGSQIRELKEKIKALNSENKDLHKTIKKLRPELQLDTNPKLRSKLTKEVVKELRERAERCKNLQQENARLNQEIDNLTSVLAQAENVRKVLEDRLLAAQSQVRSLSNEHDRVVKLWEEAKIQREQTLQINRLFRQSLFSKQHCHQTLDKCVQTIASIPIYRRFHMRKLEGTVKQQEIHWETEKVKQRFVDQAPVTPKERRGNASNKASTTIYRISPH